MAGQAKKRKSGIPTGNAGEYFVMGELLRRGFDAQLADRNTKGYDLLVGRSQEELTMRKVQVKSVRQQPWYVRVRDFEDERLDLVTVYVLLGYEDCKKPVRFFIAKNRNLTKYVSRPSSWTDSAFMSLKAIEQYEGQWDVLRA